MNIIFMNVNTNGIKIRLKSVKFMLISTFPTALECVQNAENYCLSADLNTSLKIARQSEYV